MILNLPEHIPLKYKCNYFNVTVRSFYKWKNSFNTPMFKNKKEIKSEIKKIFNSSKNTYGSPRVYQELKSKNIDVSENTVAKYMREMGLDARHKKPYKVQTTDSQHSHKTAPRLFKVEQEGSVPTAPGKVLAGDITYLRLGTGRRFLYLAVVIDLFNREVVGWSMGKSLEKTLVLDALEMAMGNVGSDARVIFHSDRGSQYASDAYRKFLKNNNVKPSMSRKGNCYDNAYVESWFSSLKKEWLYRTDYSGEVELRALVFEYIEVWYNKTRRHSSLGFLSPVEYKMKTN